MARTSGEWRRVRQVFEDAVMRQPSDRPAFLAEACQTDDRLRREVEALIRSHDRLGSFLETPPTPSAVDLAESSADLEGRRIGPYLLGPRIGAGGMGEVYKARDTRLDRSVAVKVLAPRAQFSRERFSREARAVAVLAHPHICVLHDVGHEDGIDYFVMEHLDGETLAARLLKGPLPVDVALRYAMQIASALDQAHRSGIVHRDLKPSNIMVTKAGAKLLDFGLARHGSGPLARAGRDAADLTAPGMILGTLHYMSPEQLEGLDADARTDLFAFGCVLYEMLAGRKAFDARSSASLLTAIMSGEPTPIGEVRPVVPPAVDYIIGRCLARDPDNRWQTARDLLAELQRTAEAIDASPDAAARRSTSRPGFAGRGTRARGVAWPIAVLLAIAAAGVGWRLAPTAPPAAGPHWLSILPPPEGFDLSPDPVVSPDGRFIAFKARNASSETMIWLKALDEPEARPVPGTHGTVATCAPFWSPDSRSIGFFAGGKLKRVDLARGNPQVLASAPEPRGGAWTTGGTIIFNPDTRTLMRVSAAGGAATRMPGGRSQDVRLFPHALPDGRHYFFTSRDTNGLGQGIYVGTIDSTNLWRVNDGWSPAVYARDHLLFGRQGALFAQPFSLARLATTGEPQRIADGVGIGYGTPLSFAFSASSSGVAAYWSGVAVPVTQLTWVDRAGVRVATVGEPAFQNGFALSRDERRAAVERQDPATSTYDVWLVDLANAANASKLTLDGRATSPVWSPDGAQLAVMQRGRGLVTRPAAGGRDTPLTADAASRWASDWSADGRHIAFADSTTVGWRLWTVPADAREPPTVYREGPFVVAQLQFSPDGRWAAYASDESGQLEVYVDSYPAAGHKIRISAAGGGWPRWGRNGGELYYLAPNRDLMAVKVLEREPTLRVSPPAALFKGPLVSPDFSRVQFAPSADGSRFLFNALVDSRKPVGITVVAGWPALLARR